MVTALHIRPRLRALLNALPLQAGARQPKREHALAARHYARRQPRIAAMHEAISRSLDTAQAETLRNLRRFFAKPDAHRAPLQNSEASASGSGVAADITFDRKRFREGLLARVRTESLETLQVAGDDVVEELAGLGYSVDPWSMPEPEAMRFLGQRENLLKDTSDAIHDQIEARIQQSLGEQKSLAQIARDIREEFAQIEAVRAAAIASTETAVAFSHSRQVGFEQTGVEFKYWITSHLPTVRDTHRDAEDDPRNARVPVSEAFYVGAVRLLGPGLPLTPMDDDPGEIINCHCIQGAHPPDDLVKEAA
jgi:hypothetical protein